MYCPVSHAVLVILFLGIRRSATAVLLQDVFVYGRECRKSNKFTLTSPPFP